MGRSTSELRIVRRRRWRWTAAPVLIGLAFVLRQTIALRLPEFAPLMIFFPAVLLAALLGGMWAGFASTLLSALLAEYWIFEPAGSFAGKNPTVFLDLSLFVGFGILLSVVLESLNRYREGLAAARAENAVAEERRKAEGEREKAALLQSERQRLLDILEALPAMTCLLTPEHEIAFANRAFREKYGDPLGRPCYAILQKQSSPCAFCQTFEPLKTGRMHRWEVIYPDDRVIDTQNVPFTDLDGSRLVLKMDVDVTEHRRAQTELEAHREHLEELVKERTSELEKAKREWERTFDTIPDLIAILDDRHRIVRMNRAMAERLAVNPEAGGGQTCFGCVHGSQSPPVTCPHSLTLQDGREHAAELDEPRMGGSFLVTTTPMFDETGKVEGAVHVARDITERKRAEAELKKLNRTLKAVNRSNHAVLHATDEKEFIDEVCNIIVEDCGHRMVWIGFAEHNEQKSLRVVAHAGHEAGYLKKALTVWGEGERGRGPAGEAIRSGQPAICSDMMNDPGFAPWREEAAKRGYAAVICLPFELRERNRGVICIYSGERGAFSEGETELLAELARDVEFGLRTLRDRAEHMRAMEALREEKATLQGILNATDESIWLIGADGSILAANATALERAGRRAEEIFGKTTHELLETNLDKSRSACIRQVVETGQPLEAEDERDGMMFRHHYYPVVAGNGSIDRVVAFSRDITGSRQAEETLQRYRLLAEHTRDIVLFIRYDDGLILEANRAAAEAYGYTIEQLKGMTIYSLRAPGTRQRMLDEMAEADMQGILFDSVHQRADGSVFPVEVSSQGAEIAGRRTLISIIRDVTQRKRAEEELKSLNRILKAMSRSSQAILHATDEAGFLREVCEIIHEDYGHKMVWIGFAQNDAQKSIRRVAQAGLDEGYLETLIVTWGQGERGSGPAGKAMRTGQPAICHDMLGDPEYEPWREEALRRGYASSIAVPFRAGESHCGLISIYSGERGAFSEGEVRLLTELASDVEFGIQSLRMRAAHDRAQRELERSREILGLFIESAPVAMAMFDREMRYMHVSHRWRTEYGLGDRELTGISHYEVFPGLPAEWKEAHRRGLAGESLSADGDRFDRADGTRIWVRWEMKPWYEAGGTVGGVLILTEDITRRREAEAALKENETRFRTLADALPQLVWTTGPDGVTEYYNARYLEYGIAATTDSGYDTEDTIHPEDRAQTQEAWKKALASGEPYEREHRVRTADGSYRWHLSRGVPQRDENGVIVRWIGTATDIEDLKRAETTLIERERLAFQRQQLRALAEHQEKAREEERTRVARDLHDDIGQILTAVKMELVWIRRHVADENIEASSRLNSAVKLINDGVQSVRRICSGLRPPVLDDLGLAAAIEWQANDLTKRTGVGCRLSLPSDTLDLDGNQRTACFRIFQECLTNIGRHAHARTVDISLSPQGEDLVLIVRDDGKGFRETARTGSLGLLGMRERAEVCGGRLSIDSSPGKGTTVTLRIPRRRRNPEEDHAHSDRG